MHTRIFYLPPVNWYTTGHAHSYVWQDPVIPIEWFYVWTLTNNQNMMYEFVHIIYSLRLIALLLHLWRDMNNK